MENSLTLRDTVELLLRHRILVAAVSLCTVVFATAVALIQTPIYESTAVLLIKFGREMISRPEVGDRETLVSRESAIINVEIQILRSESVINGAIQALSVERLYPELFQNPGALEWQLKTFRNRTGVTVEERFESDIVLPSLEKATAVFDLAGASTLMLYEDGKDPAPVELAPAMGYELEIDYLVNCIKTGQAPKTVTLADAAKAVLIAEAEEKSVATGQPVKVEA